jgi:magnesium chelatase family protein
MLDDASRGETSEDIKKRIVEARKIQKTRFGNLNLKQSKNSEIKAKHIKDMAVLDPDASQALLSSADKLALSPRAYHRVIRLARTIADLEKSPSVKVSHVLEALQYRQKQNLI